MLAMLPAVPAQAAVAGAPASASAGTAWHGELGMRYWFSWGNTGKDLYGTTRAEHASRLTYSGLAGNAGELFGQADTDSIFVKGYAGLGVNGSGKLQDEDFPPGITPYSSTDSAQRHGSIGYATIDAGYYFVHTANSRIGGFIGYSYLNQRVSGYGCTQTASYTACASPIPAATHVIVQDNNWNSLRLGVNGETHMGKWRLSGEAAALPLVFLRGADWHLLRIGTATGKFTGPVPEDGHGWGYQLQTMIDYWLRPDISLGLGARYWHMQTRGYTHFEGHVVGQTGSPQPVDWNTTLFGLTAQCAVHF